MKNQFYKLILLTNKQDKNLEEYLHFISICANSGITSVQLREKTLPYDELVEFSKQLTSCLNRFSIPLIINDDIKLAQQLDARGVHLGQSDGDVIDARKILGPNKIIGLTINSIEELHVANNLPLDYVAISSIFSTRNKSNIQKFWGCEALKNAVPLSKHPIVAIGGITEKNAPKVMKTGIDGVAAIGVFHQAINLTKTIVKLRNIIDEARHD